MVQQNPQQQQKINKRKTRNTQLNTRKNNKFTVIAGALGSGREGGWMVAEYVRLFLLAS